MSVKLLYSYFKISWSILHFEWIFYKHRLLFHNALATWKVLIHWGMLDFQIVIYSYDDTEQGLVGLLGKSPFVSPISLIIGNSLPSASMTYPEFQWADSSSVNWKRRNVRPGRKKWSRAAVGQVPVSPSVDTHSNIFEMFYRYWNPLQWEKLTTWWPACHHDRVC